MYLFMNAAVKNETFLEIIKSSRYTANYTDAAGNPVTKEWDSTNKYLMGTEPMPEGGRSLEEKPARPEKRSTVWCNIMRTQQKNR